MLSTYKCEFTGFAEHVLAEYLCISQPGKPNIETDSQPFRLNWHVL